MKLTADPSKLARIKEGDKVMATESEGKATAILRVPTTPSAAAKPAAMKPAAEPKKM